MSSNDVREKAVQIEQAIQNLDCLRKQLRRDAADMKAKIYARMSHTVGLLDQVDQTLVVKEEALQMQIVRLNQALGVLKAGLPASLSGSSEQELEDAVEMLKKIQLTSEESPNNFSKMYDSILAESVHNNSTDNESCLPLLNTVDFPDNVSASLSRQLEEYNDVRHQNKSIESVKQIQASTSNVTFGMPQLSNCVEDWLQKTPAANTESKDTSVFARCRPAPYPNLFIKPAGRLSERVPSTRTPAGTSSFEADGKGLRNNLQSVRKNLKTWLSRGNCSPSNFSDSCKHISTDTKMWLHEAYWQMNSLKEVKCKDFFQHLSKEPSSWLHTRAYLKKSVLTPGSQDGLASSSHVNKDTANWLQNQRKPNAAEQIEKKSNGSLKRSCDANSGCCGKTCGIKEDRWLSPASRASTCVLQLKDVCRANELCRNLSECVSQPNCLTSWLEENSTVKNQSVPVEFVHSMSSSLNEWLSPAAQKKILEENSTVKNQSVPVEFVHSMSSSLNEWLSPAAQKKIDCSSLGKGLKVTSHLFRHIPAADDPVWLLKSSSSTDSTTVPPLARFKVDKEETNLWLQKTNSSSLAESAPSGEGLRPSSTSSDADWLMVIAEDKNRQQELTESEGWSICSDSHSVSTDQLDKNLAVADEYFSKWLMQQ